MIQRSSLVVLVLLVAACGALGLPSPETFNQKLAVGYATVTQVRATALELGKAKRMEVEDVLNVNTQADVARAGLDIARKVAVTDLVAADAKLTAVHTGLVALQTYLSTKGK